MGGPSPSGRTSALQYDGSLPVVINSPVMAYAATAVSNQGSFVAPCDLEIVAAVLNVIVTPTHATADLNIGTRADADAFLDLFEVTDLATGVHDLLTEGGVLWVNKNINRGDVVEFELTAADTTGDIAVTLVCMPRYA